MDGHFSPLPGFPLTWELPTHSHLSLKEQFIFPVCQEYDEWLGKGNSNLVKLKLSWVKKRYEGSGQAIFSSLRRAEIGLPHLSPVDLQR